MNASRTIYKAILLLASAWLLPSVLCAQQLYVSNMQVRARNAAVSDGYCDDIDFKVTGTISGPISGTLSSSTVSGTMVYYTGTSTRTAVTANCNAITRVVPVNLSGTYSGTLSGAVTGYDNWANGTVSGVLTAPSVSGTASPGSIPFRDNASGLCTMMSPSQAVTCTPTTLTMTTTANGTVSGNTITAVIPATPETSPNLTCSGGTTSMQAGQYAWTGSGSKNVTGNIGPGTLTGPANYDDYDVSFISSISGNTVEPAVWSAKIEMEHPRTAYPSACLGLCASLICVSDAGSFGIDELTFEIFKFSAGSNPLDPASTPPIRTVSMYNIGTCNSSGNAEYRIGSFCTAWDATYNLNGLFGKTNGQFGFRAKVRTNQVSATAGNISIEQTAAYPGQDQLPITVDVVNVHAVKSSPTVVGRITGVAAQPY
nr:hypothetical protein [Elusimicrobiota bacterium]